MTNEQLVVLIQQGHTEYILQLWNQVEKFVSWQVRKRLSVLTGPCGATEEDLYQSGFLAVVDAVRDFNMDKGWSFLTILGYCLKREFNHALGIRSTRKVVYDPIDIATSLDVPVFEDGDSLLSEIIPDKNTEAVFKSIEDHEEWAQMARTVTEAVDALPERHRLVLHYMYWKHCTRADVAARLGMAEKEVGKLAEDALRKLRHPNVSKRLRQYVS